MNPEQQFQASCVNLNGKGVLLLGPSGSGKSDLALRLIDDGAILVADDRVDITMLQNKLHASAPLNLQGLIEARGIGILSLPYASYVELSLAINLMDRDLIERLPEPRTLSCLGVELPLLWLHGHDASACAKIHLYLTRKG